MTMMYTPPHVAEVIDRLVKSGRFSSPDEVLAEGVTLLNNRESALVDLDIALQRGIDDAEAGRSIDANIVFDRLHRKYAAMAATTAV